MQFTVSTSKAVFQTSLSKINLPGQDDALFCYWWMLLALQFCVFNIRSIGSPFLLVQHHFSQAKMNILVCFPCGVHYLCISLSLCSKIGLRWPAPAKFNGEVELWAVLWNKDLGTEQRQRWVTFLKERLPCVITDVSAVGWAIVQGLLCLERASHCAWGHVEARPQGASLHGLHWAWNYF